jgi:pimeloyl-ACP methyl ester carboxylesterase
VTTDSDRLPAGHVTIRDGGETLLLLLHGLGCSRDSFAGAFTSPHLHRYSLCALDFAGHGSAPPPAPGGRLLLQYAEDARQALQQALRELPATRHACLVGHSMGGAVAILAAARHGGISGVVSAEGNLAAADCGLASRGIASQSLKEFAMSGAGRLRSDLARAGDAASRQWGAQLAQASPHAVHRAARDLVSWCDSGSLAALWAALPSRAYLHGSATGTGHLAGLLDPAEVTVIPGSGHFMMTDNPGSFYQAVAQAASRMTT